MSTLSIIALGIASFTLGMTVTARIYKSLLESMSETRDGWERLYRHADADRIALARMIADASVVGGSYGSTQAAWSFLVAELNAYETVLEERMAKADSESTTE